MERKECTLSEEEKCNFEDAVRLFCENGKVDEYNDEILRQSCTNAVLFRAIDRSKNSTVIIHENDAPGLKTQLKLAEGAKVVLRVNLWNKVGLTNGSIGMVRKIVLKKNSGQKPVPE